MTRSAVVAPEAPPAAASQRPQARGLLVQVCRAEACRSMGGDALFAAAQTVRACTVEPVGCLGLCAQAPAVMLHGHPFARMSAAALVDELSDLGVA